MKAAMDSAKPPGLEEEDPETSKAKAEKEKMLERSKERIRKMRLIFDRCVEDSDGTEASCDLAKCENRRLNRAALKSALRALTSLVSDDAPSGCCDDDDDDEDDCCCT